MSRFTKPLRLERIEDMSRDGRGTWKLLSPLEYVSDKHGTIRVPKRFVTDLASVPRLPFAYLLTGGIGHAAAVVHDWLYTTHQLPRADADDVFHEALCVLGISRGTAWLMWAGVRLGGGDSWDQTGPLQDIDVAGTIWEANREAP